MPANLLLIGEYAVLEEGGLGITVAPDFRATGSLSRTASGASPPVSIIGHMPGSTVTWPGDEGLLGVAADHLHGLHPLPLEADAGVRIMLASDAFFRPDGGKRGLGSSAATVVALTALWLRAAGLVCPAGMDGDPARQLVFEEALDAHRTAQGGKGSGYDVACSTFGGIGLFSGGRKPVARRLDLPWFPAMQLAQGPGPVRTVSAVGRYRDWRAAEPSAADEFLGTSNRLVSEFACATDWPTASQILKEYSRLTIRLGERIGVPADAGVPAEPAGDSTRERSQRPIVRKAVGAGNEISVILGAGEAPDTIAVSREGLVWS